MVESDVKYETKSIRTVRGMEARTKAKWEKLGWEFISVKQLPMLRTEVTFRRVKKKLPAYVLPLAIGVPAVAVAALVVLGIAVGAGQRQPSEPVAAGTSTPRATPTQTPQTPATPVASAPAAVSTAAAPQTLDETTAAQFLAYQWQGKFTYGGTVHWIDDRITTRNPDGTFTFKLGATVKNADGTEMNATIEGDVSGTNAAPVITDSILYTDDGQVINFSG